MSTYGYAVEKLHSAVHILATTEGTLRDRLQRASVDILIAPTHDLPTTMAKDLARLQADLASLNLNTTIAVTLQLSKYADRLVAFTNQIHSLQHKYEPGGLEEYISLD